MLLASCDIETTGLDPEFCQVLEVGIVLWDTTDLITPVIDLPAFHCYITHQRTVGEPKALAMNQQILERIADREAGYQYLEPAEVGYVIRNWAQVKFENLVERTLMGRAKLAPTGFNFDSFDRQFLDRLPAFTEWVKFGHRSLAPATLFFNPLKDKELPGSTEVFERAGVIVLDRHTALGDARGVIEVLRAAYNGPARGPVPTLPRCPNCGDRQSVRVPTDHGEYDDIPCSVCNPHDMFGFPTTLPYPNRITGQLARTG